METEVRIVSPHRAVAPGLPAAEPAAEETAENITQIAEIEIAGETAAIAARTTVIGIDAGKAELIILRLLSGLLSTS